MIAIDVTRITRSIRTALLLITACGFSRSNAISAPFGNLGFENADSMIFDGPGKSGNGPIEKLLPGWKLVPSFALATNRTIFFNTTLFGSGQVSLYDLEGGQMLGVGRPREGRLFLGLAEPLELGTFNYGHYSLIQVGEVPPSAKSFWYYPVSGQFVVTMNGNSVPLFTGPSGEVGGDISTFAGQQVELALTTQHFQPPFGVRPIHALDGLRFSATPIPEPNTWILGIVILGVCCCIRAASRPTA